MQGPASDVESDQVNLTGVTLEELAAWDDARLSPAMARLIRQIHRPIASLGGYNS